MKQPLSYLPLALPVTALLLCCPSAGAITFTNDTAISFNNTNYDGADVVITNCTLTVDGLHSFANLQVLNGGNLTYTFAPNGYVDAWLTVSEEPQVLSVTNVATLSNANVGWSTIMVQDVSGQVTYTNGVDYLTGSDTNGMTTLLLTTNSAIAEGSTNQVSYEFFVVVYTGLSLTVTGDVTVAEGGAINVDGKGYDGAVGPGAGRSAGNPLSGSGAGYGGYGGQSAALDGTGMVYGVLAQPTDLGSGGGRGFGGVGGAGGGSVKLIAGGNLRIDGTVSANGANGINNRSGGGSGGSIWLTCQNLSGAGVLSANGGAGEPSEGGGGAGGRISLQFAASTFSGLTPARGGNGYVRGGAGTVYTRANSQLTGQVLVDNGGKTGMATALNVQEAVDLTAQRGAVITLSDPQAFGNLFVVSNAWISLSNQQATLTVTGNATIQAGGGITADGAGYAGGAGPGAGRSDSHTGGGGGYGGYGAAGGSYGTLAGTSIPSGGIPYGSVASPRDFGSGGGSYYAGGLGGGGGGAVRLSVTGLLLLDGKISAEGSPAITEGGGGGSGGSVWVTAGTLAGAGTISANGGLGNGFGLTGGGGGGGGRIAVQYGTYLFFGATSARGGSGSAWGGAGTVYTLANNHVYGQLLVDNGGQSGTNTSWSQLGPVDLTVRGGAVVTPPSSQTLGNLLVASSGWVSLVNQVLTVTGNATIQAGGGIIADGTGNAAGAGLGAGKYVSTSSGYIGGGGGYGGYGAAGGAPVGYSAYGGITYGSLTTPTELGSGGATYSTVAKGGAGGGAIRLNVTGVLQVDGRISAAGGPAISPSAGGGSGGAISLTAGTLAGSGVIAANGGAGNYLGGGGGGGRIAIISAGYDFAGLVSAYGGGGCAYGGAGTIYTTQNPSFGGQIVVDNGGQAGTNTALIGAPTSVALIVKNGAVLSPTVSQAVGTLLVGSNGWVAVPSSIAEISTLTVSGNATIQAGGGIIADGAGYTGGSGPGAGKYYSTNYEYIGGGGGYGGYGASGGGATSAYGGITYGSVTGPVDMGSGGGGNNSSQAPLSAGGAGGGAIRLNVTGTLQVDGRISARGLPGTGPSAGGGSGGGLNLTVGTLTGSGSIDASGGAGNALGGGGGGGRVAVVYSTANSFSGLISAYGGGGYAWGGAGTIYIKPNTPIITFVPSPVVIVDNGGRAGTNTSWTSAGTVDVTLKGGAVLTLPTSQTVGNLLIASNGWLVVAGPQGSGPTLTVAGDADIQAGGGIIADGTGYLGGQGQGAGLYSSTSAGYVGGGGGNGGYGASSGGSPTVRGGNTVGSLTVPSPGSGGGSYSTIFVGGAGGGPITLNVMGTLQVNGRISAAGRSGVSANAGGGSGGGINLSVGTLSGSGVIAANGGAGNGLGGGGGGGRIAIVYSVNAFFGLVSAYGGGGYAWGGAGTIYTKASSQSWGQVLVDNGGRAGTNTTWASSGTIDLTVTGAAVVSPPLGSQAFGNLLVASNGWLSVSTQILTVTSNATIRAGGGIIADGTGNAAGLGTGAGRYVPTSSGYVGGGGGYGGYGAAGGAPYGYPAYGGSTYGSVTAPVDLGSGGGNYSTFAIGGAGGGAVRLSVTGMLQVDGLISAAGGPGMTPSAGGGSGGTISLTAGTLAGSGRIAANGGDGKSLGGGGGGGRVALVYGVNNFAGVVSAYGGAGYAPGGAGTVYTKADSQSWGQVIADNAGQAGTNTTLGSASMGTIDLTVKNGAVFTPPNSLALGTLLVASNGWVTMPTTLSLGQSSGLTVTGNATVQAGGGIIADGLGYAGGSGPGAGRTYTSSYAYVGGGGGYGGYGASGGGTTSAYGGMPYGSAPSATDFGSGGGGSGYVIITSQPPLAGGAGGGAIRLAVTGTLRVDGRISARGLAGTGPSAGGGAGGSINLTVGALTGAGVISADGGAGNALGGGGGGGRIALSFKGPNYFSGRISAYGGGGYATGGAGTIFFPTDYNYNGIYGQVVVDNGGQTGTNTGWSGLGGSTDLTVSGGAVVAPSGSQSIGNLVVASNAWIVVTSSQGSVPTLTIAGNATVQAGGGIIADGTGYSLSNGGVGPGGGSYYSTSGGYVSGGGGNGGYGATSGGSPAARGGNTVGSLTIPSVGSAGGTYSSSFVSGPGGGGIILSVRGALQVDGRISAAGGVGVSANAGGGAVGGINLSVGTLAGSGVIAANGGAGNGLGGGGGGGRIAITCTTSAFSGLLTAYGGGGYAWGGAGTIYTKSGRQSWGRVLVDNGGRAGTNTSWPSTSTIDLTIMGGAVVSPPSQQTMGNLLVASNGWMSLSIQTLTVSSNATVQAGGGILADGTGYPGSQGPGAGKYVLYSNGYLGGGGGHGGLGAASGGTSSALGGSTYGSVTAPVDRGSGGGYYSSSSAGGAGGGAVRISVSGALLINGRISANGSSGFGQGSGGGSGGSVWLTAGTLAGAGIISANGGAGNELGGGGGGGCVALQYNVNAFDGAVSAYGGGGYAWGGAGTVFLKANNQVVGQLVLDNGGQHGTNTPIAYLPPFDLTIRGGAVAYPSSPSLILSNLVINSGGTFTCLSMQSSVDLAVLRNATIDAGGLISADGEGYLTASGSGAGVSYNYTGSGAGYGGHGGASSMKAGGVTYGSAQQPVDWGSGGGRGWQGTSVGGEGGGVIRLTVGDALTVNGRLSAGGNAATQDDGGGGSGGSIWLTAGALAGEGIIAADGGVGELYDGGGGGGGRIAIYTPLNVFSGPVSAAGGDGLAPGEAGSIYYASTPAPPQVVSCSPTGVLNAAVSSLDVVFNTVVNPASVSAISVSLTAPGGVLVTDLSVSALSPYSVRVSFPEQTAHGDYAIKVGPQVQDLYGQALSQVYTSAFSIVWSLVQGTVTDTNGLPVAGVVLQPDGGIPSTTTDTNGSYLLSLPPGGTIVVTPSATNLVFVPGSRTYVNVTGTVSNENYLAVSTIVPAFAMQVRTNNCVLSWNGIPGVTYQLFYSTNLVDWLPYADALPGTNGTMQVQMPVDTSPALFFRVGAGN